MDIYEPREDSYLLEKYVKEYAHGKVCDMGTGSGTLAFAAAQKADTVLALDKNPEAIRQVNEETKRRRITNITAITSDLFHAVPKGERFDFIICNPPYLPSDDRVPDLALDGGRHGYELILRFLSQAKHRLTPDGAILLLFSSRSKKKVIDRALHGQDFQFEEVAKESLDFETLYVYKITLQDMLAKGKRGTVRLAKHKGMTICVKEANPIASVAGRLDIEAGFLQKTNKAGIGPRFLFFKDGKVGMEYVKGERILDFLGKNSVKREQALAVVKEALRQCFILDTLGIEKREMTNPYKHVIVKKEKRQGKTTYVPVLIDFERCRCAEHPSNLTQFLQFLSTEKVRELLKIKKIKITALDYHDVMVKEYKNKPALPRYLELLNKLGLASFDEKCYAVLARVPRGRVTTYNEIAHALGMRAYRAVGQAMRRNPYAPEVPCHRAVGSGGKIGGFASGPEKKVAMLKKEGVRIKGGKVMDFEKVFFRL